MTQLTALLDTKDDGLEVVGGKGRSLAKLANAGFHVPGGFQVTTAAYRGYVMEHALQARIVRLAKPAVVDGRASCDLRASASATRRHYLEPCSLARIRDNLLFLRSDDGLFRRASSCRRPSSTR